MLLMRDLERAARHLYFRIVLRASQHYYGKQSCFVCRVGSHYIEYLHSSAFRLALQVSPDGRRRAPLRSLDQALLQSYHPVRFYRREIHSSEW